MFDVVNYYPSITLKLLTDSLNWAKQHVEISEEEINIVVETKSLSYTYKVSAGPKKERLILMLPKEHLTQLKFVT